MTRVSTDAMNDDMRYWMGRRETELLRAEKRISSQNRLDELRTDPLAAARAVKYDSFVARLERFEENARWTADSMRVAEGHVRSAVDVMQRVRELAVQGAHGTFAPEDMEYMAAEVDELLAELVSLGNARGPDGEFVFAGKKVDTEPFRAVTGYAVGSASPATVSVEYLGDAGERLAEVSQGAYAVMNQAGSEVFWAERTQVFATFDAAAFRVLEPSVVRVDGVDIELAPGDTVHALVAKINGSGAAVKASLDPERGSLALETTDARQLRVQDLSGQAVFAELGVVKEGGTPPYNWAPSARVAGGSLFDAVISLRDSLRKGDLIETGGRVLASVDAAMDNLNERLAELGARAERLEQTSLRLNEEIPDVTRLLAAERDVDMAAAISDLKMMEFAREAALGVSGRVLPKTLLDFLR
ncbi:MAG: flagellar hook-associated protein 3 [Spirochaetia bacterium]|nr:flagellar hook-associated protein 3 [Spirochaetia bacterium]